MYAQTVLCLRVCVRRTRRMAGLTCADDICLSTPNFCLSLNSNFCAALAAAAESVTTRRGTQVAPSDPCYLCECACLVRALCLCIFVCVICALMSDVCACI